MGIEAMQTRRLGNSDLMITPVGCGSAGRRDVVVGLGTLHCLSQQVPGV